MRFGSRVSSSCVWISFVCSLARPIDWTSFIAQMQLAICLVRCHLFSFARAKSSRHLSICSFLSLSLKLIGILSAAHSSTTVRVRAANRHAKDAIRHLPIQLDSYRRKRTRGRRRRQRKSQKISNFHSNFSSRSRSSLSSCGTHRPASYTLVRARLSMNHSFVRANWAASKPSRSSLARAANLPLV